MLHVKLKSHKCEHNKSCIKYGINYFCARIINLLFLIIFAVLLFDRGSGLIISLHSAEWLICKDKGMRLYCCLEMGNRESGIFEKVNSSLRFFRRAGRLSLASSSYYFTSFLVLDTFIPTWKPINIT